MENPKAGANHGQPTQIRPIYSVSQSASLLARGMRDHRRSRSHLYNKELILSRTKSLIFNHNVDNLLQLTNILTEFAAVSIQRNRLSWCAWYCSLVVHWKRIHHMILTWAWGFLLLFSYKFKLPIRYRLYCVRDNNSLRWVHITNIFKSILRGQGMVSTTYVSSLNIWRVVVRYAFCDTIFSTENRKNVAQIAVKAHCWHFGIAIIAKLRQVLNSWG